MLSMVKDLIISKAILALDFNPSPNRRASSCGVTHDLTINMHDCNKKFAYLHTTNFGAFARKPSLGYSCVGIFQRCFSGSSCNVRKKDCCFSVACFTALNISLRPLLVRCHICFSWEVEGEVACLWFLLLWLHLLSVQQEQAPTWSFHDLFPLPCSLPAFPQN